MRSRWTDFLTSDGEKSDRKRDTEFEEPPGTRAALMTLWEEGWARVFNALEPLLDADIERTVMIRAEPHSVMQAINRRLRTMPTLRTDRISGGSICKSSHGMRPDGVRAASRRSRNQSVAKESASAQGSCGFGRRESDPGPGLRRLPARSRRRGRDALQTAGRLPALTPWERGLFSLFRESVSRKLHVGPLPAAEGLTPSASSAESAARKA